MIESLIGVVLALIAAGASSADSAKKKGYNPVMWFFAGFTILGVFIIMFIPNMDKYNKLSEEERESKQKRWDTIGKVLGIIGIILVLGYFVLLSITP